MSIKIMPFESEDKSEWKALWQAYLEFYEADLSPEVAEQTWGRMLSPEGDINGFKAVDESGSMVGMVTFLFHGTTWSAEQRCYLHDLYTLPATRGQGVGRKLIEQVYAEAREKGAEQVYWLTQEFNYQGRILYDKVAAQTPFIKYAKTID